MVGHKVEGGNVDGVDLPLGLAMGRYAGKASLEAMTACINAVTLPDGIPLERADFETQGLGRRRRKVKLVAPVQEAAE